MWPYQEVRRLAVLTVEEMQHFEEAMARLSAMEYCEYKSVSVSPLQNLTSNKDANITLGVYCYLLSRPTLIDFVGLFFTTLPPLSSSIVSWV